MSYNVENVTFYLNLYFRKIFRLLDHVILLYGTVLGMTSAILVFAFNKVHFIINMDLSKQL